MAAASAAVVTASPVSAVKPVVIAEFVPSAAVAAASARYNVTAPEFKFNPFKPAPVGYVDPDDDGEVDFRCVRACVVLRDQCSDFINPDDEWDLQRLASEKLGRPRIFLLNYCSRVGRCG